jgi:cap1 methyltransferase
MANIDAVFDYAFVKAATFDPKTLMYFADICAGPGGFAEYLLWRMGWRAKGIGFTLKKDGLDFKLAKFNPRSPWDSFFPYYGPADDGDIYKTSNMRALQQLVRDTTAGEMMHFVTADGGCDFEGNENVQELLNKQLLLCQVACAMSLLRRGGNFVCKCFELATGFSSDLVYLVYRHFDRVSIFKPRTSRPANSERFIIATGFREEAPPVVEYLWSVNDQIAAMKEPLGRFTSGGLQQGKVKRTGDIKRLLTPETIEKAAAFFEQMRASNDSLGAGQIAALRKLHKFVQDPNLETEDQHGIRKDCLLEWGLPDEPRVPERVYDPHRCALGISPWGGEGCAGGVSGGTAGNWGGRRGVQ